MARAGNHATGQRCLQSGCLVRGSHGEHLYIEDVESGRAVVLDAERAESLIDSYEYAESLRNG